VTVIAIAGDDDLPQINYSQKIEEKEIECHGMKIEIKSSPYAHAIFVFFVAVVDVYICCKNRNEKEQKII
jgi:hypothetical protein